MRLEQFDLDDSKIEDGAGLKEEDFLGNLSFNNHNICYSLLLPIMVFK